jgi:ABC-2 type transport system permease protein
MIGASLLLARREIRGALRTPDTVIPGLMIPVVIFIIMLGMLKGLAASFGIENLAAFLMPTSVMLAVVLGSAGQNTVADIEAGYFDKLLTTPVNRWALLIGPLLADFVRLSVQALLVLIVALACGATVTTGVSGAVALLGIAVAWGLAYSSIGFAVALKTGSGAATQSFSFLWVPLLYLAPAFAPRDSLAGWLDVIATANPVTYIIEAMRALALDGWDAGTILPGLLAIALLGSVCLTLAFKALHSRLS